MGLSLNHDKCEVIDLGPSELVQWQSSGLRFAVTNTRDASFLGAPLGKEGVDAALLANGELLEVIKPRLARMAAHEAFFLLKTSFAVPRLQYMLRCAPAFASTALGEMARVIKDVLVTVLNIELEGDSYTQASLPVRWGVLGVRDVQSLAASSYASSTCATSALVQVVLPPILRDKPSPLVEAAIQVWRGAAGSVEPPQGEEARRQRLWDEPVCRAIFDLILTRADRTSRARLLAASSVDAGVWLHTLPLKSLGLCLSDRELTVATGLRVGAPIVRSHTCACNVRVEPTGHHGLSCRKSAGRQRRHALANDILVRAFRAAGVQAELEPHLLHGQGVKGPMGPPLT